MLELVQHGVPNCYLRLKEGVPTEQEAEAVRVFSELFAEITGLTLPRSVMIRREIPIMLGWDIPKTAGIAGADLGEEGFAFTVSKAGITVTGGKARGLIYGVYGFFEKYFGCRWFSDRAKLIPKHDVLTLPETDEYVSVPDFTYRRNSNIEGRTNLFSLTNRINGPRVNGMIPAAEGGEVRVAGSLAHTIGRIFIPDEMFDEHPEYFPLINGERCKGKYMQRCLTNPDVLEITIEKVREILAEDPQVRYVGISQMDGGGFGGNSCECEKCRAIEEYEGAHSGLWIWFVNQVADAIRDDYPDAYIETLAYRFTRQPPKHIVPRPNVAICMCSIECCFAHEMDKCNFYNESKMIGGRSGNGAFLEDLQGWGKLSDNLIIWDYVTNFHHYMAPFPNIHTFSRNMQIFYDNGVRGYYPEGPHDIYGGEMTELKGYLLAKLAWDRFYDVDAGMKEFVGWYCGAGAPFILDYIYALGERAEETESHFCCYEEPNKAFFSEEFMAFAEKCFDRAEQVAENDEVLARIRYWRLSLRYIRLAVYAAETEPAALWGEYSAFLADLKKYGIEGIAEHRFYDASVIRLKEIIDKQLETAKE